MLLVVWQLRHDVSGYEECKFELIGLFQSDLYHSYKSCFIISQIVGFIVILSLSVLFGFVNTGSHLQGASNCWLWLPSRHSKLLSKKKRNTVTILTNSVTKIVGSFQAISLALFPIVSIVEEENPWIFLCKWRELRRNPLREEAHRYYINHLINWMKHLYTAVWESMVFQFFWSKIVYRFYLCDRNGVWFIVQSGVWDRYKGTGLHKNTSCTFTSHWITKYIWC